MERAYEGLAHMIMETEKSHSLQSASWKPRKAVVQFQSQPEGLRIRGYWVWRLKDQEHQYPRTGGDGCTSSSGEHVCLSLTFCSIQAPNRLSDGHAHC